MTSRGTMVSDQSASAGANSNILKPFHDPTPAITICATFWPVVAELCLVFRRPGSHVFLAMLRKMLFLALACFGWNSTSGGATYQIGPTRSLQTVNGLPQLRPGDVVEIDSGTYKELMRWTSSGTATQPIVIRGVGASAPVFDAEGLRVDGVLPRPRAVFQIEGDFVTVENVEFRNARNGDNGAGIRITSANNVTVRGCRITQCDMGIMCDNNRNLVIEACEIAFNGTPLYNGYSHNLYLGGQNATLRFCSIHDALYGQNFKSRGHYTELLYNYIADSQDGEVGLVDAAETRPANSHAVMIGNVIVSKPRQSGYNSGRLSSLDRTPEAITTGFSLLLTTPLWPETVGFSFSAPTRAAPK